jgi:hypothetical protein
MQCSSNVLNQEVQQRLLRAFSGLHGKPLNKETTGRDQTAAGTGG